MEQAWAAPMTQPSPHAPGSAAAGIPLAPPAGMRDLLPREARARRAIAHIIKERFARFGYDLIATPPFEHAEVLERGLDTLDRREVLRFVDADSGEVALLRPDITPQIARVVATRLADHPPPLRLAYEGHVVRRRRGRARRQRQIAQAGVECIGLPGPDADVEVIELASETLDALGLRDHRIELGLPLLARNALAALPELLRESAAEALARKDVTSLREIALGADLRAPEAKRLIECVSLDGANAIARAKRLFTGERERTALAQLSAVIRALSARGLGERLTLDLGEVRGFGYYTGVRFSLLAEGPGEALGGGGRYDGLVGRFGRDLPATGFGLDLDHVERARAACGILEDASGPARCVVLSRGAGEAARALALRLRAKGGVAALLPSAKLAEAIAFARAWDYDAVLQATSGVVQGVRCADDARERWNELDAANAARLLSWARGARPRRAAR